MNFAFVLWTCVAIASFVMAIAQWKPHSLATPSPAVEVAAEPTPKTNDHRIVLMSDGTYRIQTYWDIKGWRDLGPPIEYESAERARQAEAAIFGQIEPPHVTEILP